MQGLGRELRFWLSAACLGWAFRATPPGPARTRLAAWLLGEMARRGRRDE